MSASCPLCEVDVNGVAVVPGLIDAVDIAALYDEVRRDLATTEFTSESVRAFSNKTFCPDVADRYDSRLILRGGSLGSRQLCAHHRSLQRESRMQIQVRLPSPHDQSRKPLHIDGLWFGNRDVRQRHFNYLVGVAVTPCTAANGSTEFVRGAHIDVAAYIAHHGLADSVAGTEEVPEPFASQRRQVFEGAPGDGVVLHYLTPHAAPVNTTSDDRIMVFFRLGERSLNELISGLGVEL